MIICRTTIHLPWENPPLTANMRLNRYVWARKVAHIRWAVLAACRSQRLPRDLPHVTVRLHYVPKDRRRRDADNLVPTLKAACDAIAAGTKKHPGYGMVRDDTPDMMTKHMPIIESPNKNLAPHARLYLTLEWEDQEATADDHR